MRRLTRVCAVASLGLLALSGVACKNTPQSASSGEGPSGAVTGAAPDGAALSMIQVADPHAAAQLAKGFYGVENNSWRWTSHEFAVVLRPPGQAAQTGARLALNFVIPQVVMDRVHSVRVSATVNGKALAPEEYTDQGPHTYVQDVPAAALSGQAVPVDFTLDHFLPPSPTDGRELGVIVSTVGFEAK